MDVSIVGAGRVGTALAVLLQRAGHRVTAASGGEASRERVERFLPGVPFLPASEAAASGDAAILSVPDDAIAGVCAELAAGGSLGPGRYVVHLSGSVSLAALDPARRAGAVVLSLHPLQTVPDVDSALDRLPGSAAAVTAWDEDGHATGEALAADAGCRPFRLADEGKPLYHAAAVVCSNYVTVLAALAERLFREAGVPRPVEAFAPLIEATVAGVVRAGPAASLTGPAARGDAGTVRRNLEALAGHAPDAVGPYVSLAGLALELAADGGLPPEDRARVEEVLAEWR